MREVRALLRHAVEVPCQVERIAMDVGCTPPLLIGEEDDDIRPLDRPRCAIAQRHPCAARFALDDTQLHQAPLRADARSTASHVAVLKTASLSGVISCVEKE